MKVIRLEAEHHFEYFRQDAYDNCVKKLIEIVNERIRDLGLKPGDYELSEIRENDWNEVFVDEWCCNCWMEIRIGPKDGGDLHNMDAPPPAST